MILMSNLQRPEKTGENFMMQIKIQIPERKRLVLEEEIEKKTKKNSILNCSPNLIYKITIFGKHFLLDKKPVIFSHFFI